MDEKPAASAPLLPSETKYDDDVLHLRDYVAGLNGTPQTSRPLNQRNVEMIRLFQAWTDLLGDARAKRCTRFAKSLSASGGKD